MEENPIFDRIVREIAGLSDPHGLLCIDDVAMRIEPSRLAQRECLLLHVDFGKLPDEQIDSLMYFLLSLNFSSCRAPNLRFFSTNPETGQIIAARRIPLDDESNGAAVSELLHEEAAIVSEWRDNWSQPDGMQTIPAVFSRI